MTQTGTLGYWMGERYAGHGHMTEAVRLVSRFMFGTLGLHRAEAACLPRNVASIRVFENRGFRREGLARRYLKINGVWQDHLLFGLLADDPASIRAALSAAWWPQDETMPRHRSGAEGAVRVGERKERRAP